MEKKILIFNYFVKKVADKEKELLDLQDDRAALLAVIFSHAYVQHRHATGCSSEALYMADPKTAEELFILLCSNAENHGDHLMKLFNFRRVPLYEYGNSKDDMSDKDLATYLSNELYPACRNGIDKEIYGALIPNKTSEELDDILRHIIPSYARNVGVAELELPAPCTATEMIDRAWNRMMEHKGFVELLSPRNKHNYFRHSNIYDCYAGHISTMLDQNA